jgi:biotin operon repressor
MKVSKESVLESFSDKQWHTTEQIANEHGVSGPTIGKRVKELVIDGFGILAGNNGYKLVEIEDVSDEEAAIEIERMTKRMVEIVTRQAIIAPMMKRLNGAARKLLPKTAEERQIVRKYLVQLTHLIDFSEIDED